VLCVCCACSSAPVDTFALKATFHYEDATPTTRDMRELRCCDLGSGGLTGSASSEFDVTPCASGTPDNECTTTIEAVLPLDIGYGAARTPSTHTPPRYPFPPPSRLVTLV
jgi:hypothetical protein